MKKQYIVALIVSLVGLLLFASSALSAPMAQTATPTATPSLAIDWGEPRTCTDIYAVGHLAVERCTMSWEGLQARYPYSTVRVIGLWVIASASDYIENYELGDTHPWYTTTVPADFFVPQINRQKITEYDNPYGEGYVGLSAGGGNTYPTISNCSGVSALGRPCEFFHSASWLPVYSAHKELHDFHFEVYVKTWDPGNVIPCCPDEGFPPHVMANWTVYPVVVIYSGGGGLPATATPTNTPTTVPGYATQLPFPTEFCITDTVSAATPTPYYSGSPTPTPTGTLVTPTPASTFETSDPVTVTPGAPEVYVSDVWEFDTSLSPWTKTSVYQFPPPVAASWSPEHGPDNISGTARLTYNVLSRPVTSTMAPAGGIVWTRGSVIPSPLYLKASVKSDGIFAGTYNFLVLHVKDSRGLWAVADVELIGTGWREITFYTADFPPYSALGLAAYSCNSSDWNSCSPKSYSDGTLAGALVDNVQVLAGSQANILATRPCPEGGEDRYRVCRLFINTIDVSAVCQAPDDWLNVGGWLSWLGCRIEKYFQFDQIVNGAQLQSMYTFGYTQEPLGSAADFAILIQEGRDSFEQARAEQPQTFSVPDMDVFFSTGGLEPIVLTVPGHDDDYLIECPEQFDTVNEGIRKGLCFSIYAVKTQPATYVFIQALNWLANLAAFIFLLQIVRMSLQTASM